MTGPQFPIHSPYPCPQTPRLFPQCPGDRAAARMQDLELFDPSSLELLDRSPAVVRTVAGARGGYQNDLGVFAPR